MNIEEAKKLIEEFKLTKETYLSAVYSFKNTVKEENFIYFIRIIGSFDKFYSYDGIKELLLLLEDFKNVIEPSDCNLGLYSYGKALLYFYIGDRTRCVEYALDAKKYLSKESYYLYYTECLLISALYQQGLYTEALNENMYLRDSIYYELRSDQQLIVILNFILIYIYLNDFEEADSYSHKLVEFIVKNENGNLESNAGVLISYINILKILTFKDERYSDEVINSTINDYVKKAFKACENDTLYSYLDIHISILSRLFEMNRINEVYEVCNSYLSRLSSDFIDCEMAKLLVKSVNKNNKDEYIRALEKCNQALEYKELINHGHAQYYYNQVQKINYINVQYEKLRNKYSHDALTKCFSRAKYDEIKKEKKFGSLIYFDVNNLKAVNDTFGHKFGDKYLIKFVSNVKQAMPNDDLYRIGGDEFILISNDSKPDLIIKKLETLSKMKLYHTKRIEKFSAGIVINETNLSISAAEEKADKVLYDVKNIKEEYYRFYK